MPIELFCECGQRFLVQDDAVGDEFGCHVCRRQVRVPIPAPYGRRVSSRQARYRGTILQAFAIGFGIAMVPIGLLMFFLAWPVGVLMILGGIAIAVISAIVHW